MKTENRYNRCKMLGLCLVALSMVGAMPCSGGEHANGALIIHIAPDVEYTTTSSYYAGLSDLGDPEDAVVTGAIPVPDPDSGILEASDAQVWYVMACFADSPGPVNLKGITFGFDNYDSANIEFIDYGSCFDDPLELSTMGWPGPNEGTAPISTTTPKYSEISEIYWFASYVYGKVEIRLGPYPDVGSGYVEFANSSAPVVPDYIEDESLLGSVGFGTPGYNPFAPGPPSGACCFGTDCDIVTFSYCEDNGGSYQGDHTDCFPTPCDEAILATWGELKDKFYY